MILLLKINYIHDILGVIDQYNSVEDIGTGMFNDISNAMRINGYVNGDYDNVYIDLDYSHPNKPFTYSILFNNYRKFKINNILT